ncbi:MAG: MBOAT family protein [Bacteroidales bacterium]|nr:MBOAT family protein [Bacteroidales bacterium]MDD4713082.1 MBOAT family protein [Bacteroidales bacterium]
MLFNSLNFAIFFPIVFIIYWGFLKNSLKYQNLLLLVSSCFFYACWDWRFLFLLFASIVLVYFSGRFMGSAKSQNIRKVWLLVSVIFSLGLLGVFKYYHFFTSSFTDLLSTFGIQINTWSLKVVLPVGISFYTFHGLSYIIDLYNRKIEEEKDFVNYAVFVSFFPLLIAGPIERATHLLPQIKKPRIFEYTKAVDGVRQILWGLFKKIVIADNCAEFANLIFNNSANYSGSTLFLGAIFFTFQIYCDFSGYSDIALGTARLLGIELLRNFAFPYFARDIAEFWRRWHISLTTWFRDYVYIPLGGSRCSKAMVVRNTLIIFLVSGFWHGANWTFIIWGTYHALLFLPLILMNKNRKHINSVSEGKRIPQLKEIIQMSTTFFLVVIGWIFFRADSIGHAFDYISEIISPSLFTVPKFAGMGKALTTSILVCIFMIIEWLGREQQYAIARLGLKWKRPVRYAMYYAIIVAIFWFGGKEQQFIYFQF